MAASSPFLKMWLWIAEKAGIEFLVQRVGCKMVIFYSLPPYLLCTGKGLETPVGSSAKVSAAAALTLSTLRQVWKWQAFLGVSATLTAAPATVAGIPEGNVAPAWKKSGCGTKLCLCWLFQNPLSLSKKKLGRELYLKFSETCLCHFLTVLPCSAIKQTTILSEFKSLLPLRHKEAFQLSKDITICNWARDLIGGLGGKGNQDSEQCFPWIFSSSISTGIFLQSSSKGYSHHFHYLHWQQNRKRMHFLNWVTAWVIKDSFCILQFLFPFQNKSMSRNVLLCYQMRIQLILHS